MKQTNRLLSLLLCCTMLLSLLPVNVFADNTATAATEEEPSSGSAAVLSETAEPDTTADTTVEEEVADNVCGDGLTWAIDGHTLTISYTGEGTGVMYDWEHSWEAPWCEAGEEAVYTIILEDGVSHISSGAFYYLDNAYKLVFLGAPPTWGENCLSADYPIGFYPEENDPLWEADDFAALDAARDAGIYWMDWITDATSGTFGEDGEGTAWSVEGDTLTISPGTIPSSDEEGWAVDEFALYQMDEIRNIVIEDGITYIGEYAFANFPYVEKVMFKGDCPYFSGDYFFFGNEILYYPADNATWDPDNTESENATTIPGGDWAPFTDATSGTFSLETENGILSSNWSLDGNTLTISGKGEMPYLEHWSFYPWSYYSRQIEHVVIEEGVTSVGWNAFGKSLVQPVAVEQVDPSYAIETVTLPSTLWYIDDNAFLGCENLKTVNWEDLTGLECIDSYAFANCTALESVSIPASLLWINDYAFSQCYALTDVTFAHSADDTEPVYLGYCVFSECTALEEIELPHYSEDSGGYIFSGCSSLKSVTLDPNSPFIPYGMFEYCSALTGITLPKAATSIESDAFYGSGLTAIHIPASVAIIEDYAFKYCADLKTVTFEEDSELGYIGYSAFYKTGLTAITIPASVSTIEYEAFAYCADLKTVTFEEGSLLDTLGNYAFQNSGLTAITIPASVYTIGRYAFSNCADLNTVTFEEGSALESLGEYAFQNSGLTAITIPETVTTVGKYAFSGCAQLESAVFAIRNTEEHDTADAAAIGEGAFQNCTALKEIDLPTATFGNYIFKNCTALERVTTGFGTTALGQGTFYGCTALNSVHLAPSILTIDAYTFYGCAALETITIPPKVSTIDVYAFHGSGLKTVIFGGTAAQWSAVNIYSYNTPLTSAAFRLGQGDNWYMTKAYKLVITDSVFTGETEGVDEFGDKRSWVKSIEIQDAVTDIASGAFHAYSNVTLTYSNLTISANHPNFIVKSWWYILSKDGTRLITLLPTTSGIELPATITHVDDYAFYPFYSYDNNNITFLGNAPTLSDKALSGCTPSSLYIYIDPAAEGWSYPNWNGMTVNCDAIIDTVSLDADNLTGGTVTLTATTKLDVPGYITLYYSLDGENWTSIAGESKVSEFSKSFEPGDLDIPSDVEYVWFSAGTSDQPVAEVTPIQIPVNITVPAPVTGLTLKSVDMNLVTLAWDMIPDEDHELFSHFLVERKTADGEYKTIRTIHPDSSGALTCGINDTSVAAGTTYTYRVSSVYSNGYAGQAAELEVTTKVDDVIPALTSLTPASRRYNTNFTATAKATDNDGLASIRFDYSVDGGESWTELSTVSVSGTSATATASVDISEMPDGELRVRAVAADRTGNVSAEYAVGYVLDRVAPAPPVLNEVTDRTTKVLSITWSAPADEDVASFQLYRSSDGETWSKIATTSATGYTNSGLTPNTTYYYKAASVDTTGNVGEFSDVLSATTSADTVAPKTVTISPASGYTFGPSQTIQAYAYDETALGSLTIYYRAADSEGEWQTLKTVTTSSTSYTLKTTLTGLTSGSYELYAQAVDGAGNTTDSDCVTYTLDADPPVVSSVSVEAGLEKVTVSWTTPNESDLAGFYVYRGNALAASVSNQDLTSYTIVNTLPWNMCQGASYLYKVKAVDQYGNSSELTADAAVIPTATSDTTVPVAYVNMVDSTFAGDSNYFSSTGSYDDRGIASYAWDMGDGTTYSKSSFSHTYEEGGTYTVTLTITDTSGNTATASDTIHVIDDSEYTTPKITVLGYESASPEVTFPLSGAQVVFDLGGENVSYYTGSNGTIQFRRLEEGTIHIGAYKDGYLPASADITLVHGQPVEATLKLEKKPIVTGTLTTRELTYQEIVDLGIDVTDPSNQNVYHFSASINIGGNITEYDYYYNDSGEEVDGGGAEVKVTRVGNSTYTIKPHVTKATRPSSNSSSGGSNVGREEVTIPYVTVLEIPGTVSVLKQFYEAELTIINQADDEFYFDDCTATLSIPKGLTLIPTETTAASATTTMTQSGQDVGVIQGQGSASVKWILRGDAPGSYDLSATFNATLRDFDAAISAEFQAEESIEVRDPKDIHLDMYISNTMLNRTFYMDLELYCDSGTLNLPKINLEDYTPTQIVIRNAAGAETEATGTVTELLEGETLVYKYEVVLDESVPLLFQSNIIKGELESSEMTVNRYVRNINKFDLFEGGMTDLDVFIATLPTLSESDARDFWCFINNTSTPPPADNMIYRILVGDLDTYDGTLEELRMHILSMFEVVRALTNTYVKDADDNVGYLTTEMTNALWDCIEVNPEDDAWTNARSAASEKLFEDMIEWFSELDGISHDGLMTLQGIGIAVNGLDSTWETMQKIINGMRVAVSTIGLVFESEYSGRYAYFNYYLNQRIYAETPSDSVFQVKLSAALMSLADKYWISELLDTVSWITGKDSWTNHTAEIEQWAELMYQLEVVALYYDNGDTTESHRVNVTNGDASQSTARPGTTVTVTADETMGGEEFSYWRWSCDEAIFQPEDNTQRTMTFTMPQGSVHLEAVYGEPISVIGGSGLVTDGMLTVTADRGSNAMTFLRWEVISPAELAEELELEEKTLTFLLPDAPVTLRAVFTPTDEDSSGAPAADSSHAIIYTPEISGSSVTATLSYLLKDDASPTAICVFYDAKGVMVDSDSCTLSFGTVSKTFRSNSSFSSAKIFVLDSLETLRPLCPAATAK